MVIDGVEGGDKVEWHYERTTEFMWDAFIDSYNGNWKCKCLLNKET